MLFKGPTIKGDKTQNSGQADHVSLIERRLRICCPGVLHDDNPCDPTARAAGNDPDNHSDREHFQFAVLAWEGGTPLAIVSCQEDAGRISIGRSVDAQIRIEDHHISRFHAELHWDAGAGVHMLTDLQSANGTYVDDRRIRSPVIVRPGMRLRFGRIELIYQRELRQPR